MTLEEAYTESISSLVSSPLCWQSACDLRKGGVGRVGCQRQPKASVYRVHLKERHQELVYDQMVLNECI